MKWKQVLSQCNLTEDNISIGLKTKIRDYYTIVEGIEELKNQIANPSINDDVDDLQEDLADLEESIIIADNKLCRAIEVYDKNKEKYAELSKNLGKGRPRKDGLPPQPKQQAQPQPQPTPQEQPKQVVQSGVETYKVEVEGEKKKSSFGILGTILIVGVSALIGVNLLRNRN
jgi:hypothetical protein